MTRLIALCSPAMGSGKSEAAHHLVARHGFTRIAFATPLKMMTVGLLEGIGIPQQEIQDRVYGDRKEEVIPEIGVTARRVMQTIGTEWGRETISDSLWVDLSMAVANRLLATGRKVVIDDMRFINEHDAVLCAGGIAVRIIRPGAQVTAQHASEGELDRLNMHNIVNDCGLQDLRLAVDSIFNLRETRRDDK